MHRVLLFVEPKPLPQHLFRNRYWIDFPLSLIQQLHTDAPGEYEFHVALPHRFRHRIKRFESIFGHRVYYVDERELIRKIHDHRKNIRDVWTSDFKKETPHDLRVELDSVIDRSIPMIDWDVIFSFGEPCRYSFAANCFCLNLETSPFGRFPFRPSFFMDHCGLFRDAAPSRFFKTTDKTGFDITPNPRTQAIQSRARRILCENRKLIFEKKYANYILLPLQASSYSSFDAQSDYESQIDYLFDVVKQIDNDMGIVVTEHPALPTIDHDNDFQMVLKGLADLFPNVTYVPRAKYFSSGSFQLLPDVDAVWTQASNIGPVASLLGLPTGTPTHTHISYSAHANSLTALSQFLGQRFEPGPVFDWMFSNYVIPNHKASQAGWLHKYLLDRIDGFRNHGRKLESFGPTNCAVEDFIVDSQSPNQPLGTTSLQKQTLLRKTTALYRSQKRWFLKNHTAGGDGPTFILLNDTAELETFRHIGCNYVIQAIHNELDKLGFQHLASINRPEDIHKQLAPDWVIINGEGTYHHDSPRGKTLLKIADGFKTHGAKVALLNTIWEDNQADTVELLRAVDLVSVRDKESHQALNRHQIKSIYAPDFSLGQWHSSSDEKSNERIAFCDSIVFERARQLFDCCLYLDGDYYFLDDRQMIRMNQDGCFQASPANRLTPALLTEDQQLASSSFVITGRFHAAVACIAMKKPFLFVESNTRKISNLCSDFGLPVDSMNITREIERGEFREVETRIKNVQQDFANYLPAINQNFHQGIHAIGSVFQKLNSLSKPLSKPTQNHNHGASKA